MVTCSLLNVQLVVVAYKEVMEVLIRCWSDGDVVPTSVPVSLLELDRFGILLGEWEEGQGGSIIPKGFMSSVLLWLVIIVAVVDVTVVVVIIVVVVVVVESSSSVKLSFVIT
ncbi:hypothetical protein Tco_0899266 [Tanacetum coccineum]